MKLQITKHRELKKELLRCVKRIWWPTIYLSEAPIRENEKESAMRLNILELIKDTNPNIQAEQM